MATENLTSGWVFRPPLPSKWMVNTYSYHAQCFRVLTYIHLRIIWLFHGYQVCMYAKETWFVFLSQLSLREWDINDWLIFNQSNYYYWEKYDLRSHSLTCQTWNKKHLPNPSTDFIIFRTPCFSFQSHWLKHSKTMLPATKHITWWGLESIRSDDSTTQSTSHESHDEEGASQKVRADHVWGKPSKVWYQKGYHEGKKSTMNVCLQLHDIAIGI